MASLLGINANKHCQWCHYINCVPTKMWSCNERPPACEVLLSSFKHIRGTTILGVVRNKFHTVIEILYWIIFYSKA